MPSEFNPSALAILLRSDDVEYVAEDGILHTTSVITQQDAPWGLQRITQPQALANTNPGGRNFQFTYDSVAGTGVDIYIVDTGVLIPHKQFGGRARYGANFVDLLRPPTDDNGHGTHCAGTAGGLDFGVAKNVTIIAVKVPNEKGSGSLSGIVSAMGWVVVEAEKSKRPSVVSMSLRGSENRAIDDAVKQLTSKGIHVIVAAGNNNADAGNFSPARAPSAITVGASDIDEFKASFSNYGPAVDIFAPGQSIISSWIGSDTATASISGTSMATPHVAGIVAYLISKDGNITPAQIEDKAKQLSAKKYLKGIPIGTENLLAQIGPVLA
ncbi:serine protease [Coprinopsis marcescibilis]|uniref:Serine protease n=1 Tax=Coprinopsis marcescibilis TaxID=230819 RepID=A0A5C3KQ15_COPMA|nr:serine protease [Coprinopsis marcescibilis]